ncbi:uncharacterized protein [Palaemon carinicauda]|uniref:uncharacterized protein n=1 Tax=Palaemon carinicauda TaxID=392227 RepID=UPI0035B68C95
MAMEKMADLPPEPARLQDLQLQAAWTETSDAQRNQLPRRFLLNDNGPDTDSSVIIFATDDHLRLLAEADTWLMDGCYAIAPAGFLQLYTIQVPLRSIGIPVVYALLQRKTQATYEEMFQAIQTACEERRLQPDPEKIILDFEAAAISAVKQGFGDDIGIQGCYYHFTQSTWRKVQELGLTNRYREDAEFRLLCGKLDGLAFLPPGDVREGMELLIASAPDDDEVMVLLTYFDLNYVTGTYRERPRRDNSQLVLRHIPPRFLPNIWNVHDATVTNNPRTNNICEGWNARFQSLAGHNHPTVWKLIKLLQGEEAVVSTKVLQDSVGNPQVKRVKRVYVQQQQRLQTLC